MNYWVDTHAHIYHDDFKDLEDVISRAHTADVKKIFMPNVDHTSIDNMLEVEMKFPNQCYAMMGLHPCSVDKNFEKELYLVEEWLGKRKFCAIGEIGTDRYWDTTYWEYQKEAFTVQVNWARKHGLPIVIHCRESLFETIDMLEPLQDGTVTGIFHCYTGDLAAARRIAALGFFLGIGGVSTFKKGGLDLVLPEIPLDQLVLETDSPYLAPVPHRGKRNEPSYIPLIARRVAEIKNCTLEDVMRTTTVNANKLFDQK